MDQTTLPRSPGVIWSASLQRRRSGNFIDVIHRSPKHLVANYDALTERQNVGSEGSNPEMD